jgi:questin oxidase-like protein
VSLDRRREPPEKIEMTRRLATLLARNRELKPEYGGGLSNHVSMGLFSLSALGASDDQLSAFAEASWPPLEPLSPEHSTEVNQESFARLLGKPAAFSAFRTLFQRELSTLGRADTLRKYLPALLPGIGAAGFHALIRTAYGVRFENDDEVADGLSYWASAFLPLGSLEEPGVESEPRALLAQVHDSQRLADRPVEGALILERMRNAAHLPSFADAVNALQPRRDTLAQLAAAAVRLYTSTHGDFTALHTVTGTHAFRLLSPFIRASGPGLRYLWQAFVAAYVAIRAPAIVEPVLAEPLPDWPAIVSQVLLSSDAHDLKLVDVAREEGAFYREPIYRHAAALRAHLLRA